MKRFFTIIYVLLTASALCADIPAWLKKPEKEFPEAQYIRALSEGNSVQAAKNTALTEISLYFDTKTDIIKHSINELSELVKNGEAQFSSVESYKTLANISSNAEFFCTQFTEPYYNKKSKTYSVLAYINRAEAAQIYTARIDALMQSVESYRRIAQQQAEPFHAAQALRKAEVLAEVAAQYIKTENTIVPDDIQTFRPYQNTIALLVQERAARKKQLTFAVSVNPNEKRYDPLFSTVAALLEKDGYAYSVSGAAYQIIIDVSCIEEQYDAGPFVRPSLDVLIVNSAGEGVYTYSKALPRTGSKTMAQAYTRAVSKMQQDLEENFLKD